MAQVHDIRRAFAGFSVLLSTVFRPADSIHIRAGGCLPATGRECRSRGASRASDPGNTGRYQGANAARDGAGGFRKTRGGEGAMGAGAESESLLCACAAKPRHGGNGGGAYTSGETPFRAGRQERSRGSSAAPGAGGDPLRRERLRI